MRWEGGRRSGNIEDRRGMRGPMVIGGGLGAILLLALTLLGGGDPTALISQLLGGTTDNAQVATDPRQEKYKEFVQVVLADTEDVWHSEFRKMGKLYREPKLVLFSGHVQSACGAASSAVGPFYCPGDEKVYLDLIFFDELERRFRAPGDFAQAYVIAHEVGHHVQDLLGISGKVEAMRRRISEEEANRLSVRLELQADFFAGLWAHHAQAAKKYLDEQDIKEALRAANAIGDDTLQKQSQGYVVPDSFTHGTSEQRIRWFRRGWDSGRFSDGDTFNTRDL